MVGLEPKTKFMLKRKKEERQNRKKISQIADKEPASKKQNLDDLARGIVVSYDTRVKVVGEIIEDTHKMMDDFREKREDMSKELKEHLAKKRVVAKK